MMSLQWGPTIEDDFSYYSLYRGSNAGFVPGPGNLVVSQPGAGYTYDAGQVYYYKLASVDIHGNWSPFALLTPQATVDVPALVPSDLMLGPPRPNPMRSGAEFHFALPREGRVTLALFDQRGRRVRDLVNQALPPGDHVARWDGRDDAGRPVPSGIYFCRLEADGRNLSRRLAAIQ